jgi:hypothetical protein
MKNNLWLRERLNFFIPLIILMIIWAPQEYSGAEGEIHDSRQNAEEF